jgi:hypothetical protein
LSAKPPGSTLVLASSTSVLPPQQIAWRSLSDSFPFPLPAKSASPAPSIPTRIAEFPWLRSSSRPIERQVEIPPQCEPPLPERCRALGLSIGVVGKFSQPVILYSQDDLPDECDTRSAFPSPPEQGRLRRFRKGMCGEEFNWFSRTGYT